MTLNLRPLLTDRQRARTADAAYSLSMLPTLTVSLTTAADQPSAIAACKRLISQMQTAMMRVDAVVQELVPPCEHEYYNVSEWRMTCMKCGRGSAREGVAQPNGHVCTDDNDYCNKRAQPDDDAEPSDWYQHPDGEDSADADPGF